MGVVLEYFSGELGQVTRILESAKNRQLIGLKIILAQEEERKRISREIHDGPAQLLANLVLRTEIVERMLAKQEFKLVQDEIVDLKAQVRSSLEEMRKVIFNLRPMALDDLGLIPTLRKYVHDYEEKTKIRATFETRGKGASVILSDGSGDFSAGARSAHQCGEACFSDLCWRGDHVSGANAAHRCAR
ncbi:hypothetical protein HMSSN036_58920 [Paenibacillus macerans]|nr:hypothetical protein HMSSN036_58920 [Paenibacillus macerans]